MTKIDFYKLMTELDSQKPSFDYLFKTYANILRISTDYIGQNQIRYRMKSVPEAIGLWISKAEVEKRLLSVHKATLDRKEIQKAEALQTLEDAFGPSPHLF